MFRHASLNRIYRLVWSEARNAYVAVAETSRARGKRSSSVVGAVGALALGALSSTGSQAAAPTTVVPTGGNTAAYIAPNGVPVVDINTANAAGVSHNQYLKYNVDNKGLVLNNGNTDQMARQSQLAGQVMANSNLAKQATLILNEVVAPNRSQLSGFTEVLGGKADVVVANPYGITCSGCGFINTDRVTLTTGVPVLGGNGALNGFRVTSGDLLINGSGLNASAQQILDLVARSIKIDGQINANDLSLTAGANSWDYASRAATGTLTPTDTTPAYAIDSTVLGGMYANRIKIVATEAGVGVRMLGEAAATASDFSLDANGKIVIQSKLSAARDIQIASTASDADALALIDGSITAQRNLDLNALLGGATFNGGALLANNNFTLNAGTLSDTATASALADNNKRFAGAGLHIHATGSVDLNGVSYGSGAALAVEADNLTIGADGATLYSGTTLDLNSANNLALANAALKSAGAMHLTAQHGNLGTGNGAGQGIQATAGDIVINTSGMTSAGTISADAGALSLRVDDLSNSGTLHSAQLLSIADQSGDGGENIDNSGSLSSDATLDIIAHNITNTGRVQSALGSTVNALSLTNSGAWIGSTASDADTNFYLHDLTNAGTLQSANDLNLTLLNALINSGKILATHDLAIAAASAGTTLAVNNQTNGALQAGNLLQLQGTAGAHNLTLTTQAGSQILGKRLNVLAASVTNAGRMQGGANGTGLDISGALNNSGDLLSTAALNILAATITNSGTVQSALSSTTTAASLTNTGTWLGSTAAGNSATFNLQDLTNSGTLQSEQDLSLNLLNTLTNSGTVLAKHDLLIEAVDSGTTLAVKNQNHGTLQATNLLQVRGTGGADNATLLTENGSQALANRLNVIVASLTNAGILQGGTAASTITVNGTLTNSSTGKIFLSSGGAGGGTIDANTLSNAGDLESKGSGTTALNIGSTLTNTGTTLSTGAMTVRGRTASTYSISDSGRLESSDLLDIKGYGGSDAVNITVGATGILRGGSMDIDANTLTVNDNGSVGGIVNTTGNMTLNLNTLSFGGSHSRIVGATTSGNTAITLANTFSNPGAIHSGGNLTFNLPSLTNTSTGGISSLKTLTLHATAGNLSNAGALYAGQQLTASSTATFTNTGTGTLDSNGGMALSASTFTNNNNIVALGDITITAAIFQNDVGGDLTRAWDAYVYGVDTRDSSGDHRNTDVATGCVCTKDYLHYYKSFTRSEYFLNSPDLSHKPQILSVGSNGTITIQQFDTATNKGGAISAANVTITGNSGSTFTNDSLSLSTETGRYTWDHLTYWYGVVDHAAYDDQGVVNGQFVVDSTVASSSTGAGIYANSGHLTATGFTLVNSGSPLTDSVQSKTENGATAGTSGTTATPVTPLNPVSGGTTVNGEPTVAFPGVTITLPTNPNGYFVTNKDPQSQYLVETNPLFGAGSNSVGSNYLAERFGYNPDVVVKKLGDANYEAYLTRQQLIAQLGTNLIGGYASEAAQMQGLMDKAVSEGKRLGFTYGKPLSADQLANLKEDVVWMVETVVAGQKVLAPVVYLSNATKANYEAGNAVIAGSTVDMRLDALTNTGGTISGSQTLNIASKGDITNTGGTIKGGDVTLASTEGSIINQTLTSTSGNDKDMSTTIGKQGSIQSTGNLSVDAAKDITNRGANMAAGGDASLSAGGNVTFDTVENKTARSTSSHEGNGFTSTDTTTTTSTTEQIKSGLTSGGNLTVKSKNDITFAGTDVKAGGDADIDAKGNVNFLARANTNEIVSSTTTSGLGVGGGLAGVQQTDSDDFHSRNVGSSLEVGGNAKLNAGKDLTLEGSKADIKGNADINATNVNILAGKDLDRSTSTTTTTTFLKVDTGSSDSSSGSQSGSSASSGDGAAGAEASAGAQAEANAQGGLKFAETTSTHKETVDQTSVGSSLNVGGNMNMTAKDTVKLTGSEINTGGDANIAAKDVKVLAAQDIHTSSEKTTTTSIGLMASSENKASADASADANADSNNMDARANANAKAEA
ncbi:MAG TPA: hemagglutinin repeat-containing protein, partial [Spongiibacteraceae bacterium]|nr:hemagglutinin repeat-containing protein [Spongiibacteraceae bacterium]